eukprot:scaffold495_cov243-Pinguiococcus_pyrenoidosus.AAC.21
MIRTFPRVVRPSHPASTTLRSRSYGPQAVCHAAARRLPPPPARSAPRSAGCWATRGTPRTGWGGRRRWRIAPARPGTRRRSLLAAPSAGPSRPLSPPRRRARSARRPAAAAWPPPAAPSPTSTPRPARGSTCRSPCTRRAGLPAATRRPRGPWPAAAAASGRCCSSPSAPRRCRQLQQGCWWWAAARGSTGSGSGQRGEGCAAPKRRGGEVEC